MLGPYRIVGVVGEGGMGVVYRAKDTRLGRDVAIKVLTNVATTDREHLQRFEQEARATGMLNHPNLLTIYDVGHDGGGPYIVSELLEGETLRDRLTRGPLPPRRAVDAALQIAQGLAAAHEKAIIHRDLKPEYIFLTRDGRAKILDFGIAKLTASAEGAFKSAATEPGMVIGTVGYMSPEQVRGDPLDTRSDIFSFGVIFYEMLSGARAFKRETSIETLRAILKEDPPELTEKLPNIPQTLERLVRRCLEKDRELRFQSARDLAFNLETLSFASSSGTFAGSTATPRVAGQTATMRVTAPPARTMTTARPVVPPKRRVSPLLLTLLYIVSIGGAAFGGWYFANRMKESAGEVTFQRLTFRRGEVHNARFAPDGDTIVYSAAWDGRPSEIFVANRRSPEARPLGVSDADVLGIAKTTEIALLLRRDRVSDLGTLARIPLAGGTPREVAEQVQYADWSPDGANLVAIRSVNGKYLLEAPVGSVRYETPHPLHHLRVAPDGRIAFLEWYGGKEEIALLAPNAAKPVAVARGWRHGANGLAWSENGKELWITGTDTAAPPALYAVNVDTGETRLVTRFTGLMKLFDISPASHVLLSTGLWRAALEYQAPGDTVERDMSWLDWSNVADISRDGTKLLFNETREGGGAANAIYLRAAGAAPVRIGDGLGDALSPDGKFVLAHNGLKLAVVPTGTGEARDLKVAGAFDSGAVWVPNSSRVIVAGTLPEKGYQLLRIDTLDETVKPVSPEGIWGEAYRPFAVSPDGRTVAGMSAQKTIALYDIEGTAQGRMNVAGVEPGEVPIQWSADASSLFVYRPTALPARVYRVNLATGARELWKEFTPVDPAGVYKIAPICITPEGNAYAYDAFRMLSDLYVADGMK